MSGAGSGAISWPTPRSASLGNAPAPLGNWVRYWGTVSGILLGISSSSHAPSSYVFTADVPLTNVPEESGNKSAVSPTQQGQASLTE